MKILEIEIKGTASEVVVGSLSREELSRIHEVMRENDLVDDDQYDYNSFYFDSYLVEEAEVCAWHDTDNFLHQHGSYIYGTIVVRNHETGEELYNGELSDLFKDDEYGPEKNEFTKEDLIENQVLFYALTTETGTPFSGRIEVEDDHVFDIKLLTFSRISAKVNDWDLCEIIEYIMYDDEDVDNDYYTTSGKDFVIEIFDE